MALPASPFAAPEEPALQVMTCGQLLINALVDAGIIGIDEAIEQPILNRAFIQANWILAQWARKRWLCYRIQDYSFTATGAISYTVGLGQTIDINPRPDRIEYAFLRLNASQTTQTTGDFNPADFNPADFNTGRSSASSIATAVDIPLYIIQSHEEYARLIVKFIGTFPQAIFYDPLWPIGLLFPWPVPQQSIYEVHVGFKVVLPRFASLNQTINFPPEYAAALNWTLARRFRATYQMPADSTIDSLARDALNTLRLANAAMPTLNLPRELTGRSRAYDYRSDQP
jgi:hypothetical protein